MWFNLLLLEHLIFLSVIVVEVVDSLGNYILKIFFIVTLGTSPLDDHNLVDFFV